MLSNYGYYNSIQVAITKSKYVFTINVHTYTILYKVYYPVDNTDSIKESMNTNRKITVFTSTALKYKAIGEIL